MSCAIVRTQQTPSACLQGSISVGETLELPALKVSKHVRSMQMFKRPVTKVRARQADLEGWPRSSDFFFASDWLDGAQDP